MHGKYERYGMIGLRRKNLISLLASNLSVLSYFGLVGRIGGLAQPSCLDHFFLDCKKVWLFNLYLSLKPHFNTTTFANHSCLSLIPHIKNLTNAIRNARYSKLCRFLPNSWFLPSFDRQRYQIEKKVNKIHVSCGFFRYSLSLLTVITFSLDLIWNFLIQFNSAFCCASSPPRQ